jgi:hypothetical protein
MQQVRAQDDGGPLPGAFHDRLFHAPHPRGVEARQRLVEQQDRRLMQQATGDGELLLHAPRQRFGEGPGLLTQLQLLQQGRDARVGVPDPVQPGGEPEVFFHGEVVEQARLVRHEGELAFGADGIALHVTGADANGAARRADDADETAQRRGLAGAVGPDESQHLARRDGERQILHRD